jgi:hypothetical protein
VHVVLIFPFSRLCRCALILEGIESVHFRGPSYMGERVLVQTSVNRVFSNNRLDKGFCVQASVQFTITFGERDQDAGLEI